jgi:TonB family protein
MHRFASTCILFAALAGMAGQALADDVPVRVTLPVANLKQCVRPAYPQSAVRDGEEGYVELGIHVDADGHVLETKILSSTGSPALDKATAAAFGSCAYEPGKVNGQPTTMWTRVQYIWSMDPSNGKMMSRLKQAALDGDARSRYLLAAYALARVKTDDQRDQAMALQRTAAEAGEPMAQVAVGAMYEHGRTVPRDMAEARRWYGLAAAQGNVYAIDHLRLLGTGE